MVLELIVFRKCILYLAQVVQDGLFTVWAEISENKGVVLKKRRALQTAESVITVIFLFVLLKTRCHDISSTMWCVLCLLFMLLNGTRVITSNNFAIYEGERFFLTLFSGFLVPYFFCFFPDFMGFSSLAPQDLPNTTSVHKVAH